jgi:hypothetical protein
VKALEKLVGQDLFDISRCGHCRLHPFCASWGHYAGLLA